MLRSSPPQQNNFVGNCISCFHNLNLSFYIILEKLHACLENLSPEVQMPEDLRKAAEAPLLRMLEQSK
ncbi:hypothetical protein [Persicirhabdus sediminis]|uniref:Uncharacterized protein n=1 Tax=Persicirhabdus sediminis TaxID=454144 RepID=A0A8J7SM57_9BACT|nr:hypothetical protein [Persicirhabdus sediminis]MBK1790878.1 hypothetical protein [Persicirhabdus sediminis]